MCDQPGDNTDSVRAILRIAGLNGRLPPPRKGCKVVFDQGILPVHTP
ncbi:hypothetical protein ABIA45_006540 [Bradyrhizobium sp. USDA 336]